MEYIFSCRNWSSMWEPFFTKICKSIKEKEDFEKWLETQFDVDVLGYCERKKED